MTAHLQCAFCTALEDPRAPQPAQYVINGHSVCQWHVETAETDRDFARAVHTAYVALDAEDPAT